MTVCCRCLTWPSLAVGAVSDLRLARCDDADHSAPQSHMLCAETTLCALKHADDCVWDYVHARLSACTNVDRMFSFGETWGICSGRSQVQDRTPTASMKRCLSLFAHGITVRNRYCCFSTENSRSPARRRYKSRSVFCLLTNLDTIQQTIEAILHTEHLRNDNVFSPHLRGWSGNARSR